MKVRILPEAEAEIREAAGWYEQRRRGLGTEFATAFRQRRDEIATNPSRFALSDDSPVGQSVRACQLKRFPFVILYEVTSDDVVVLAVAHAKRRPGFWKRRLS